MELNYAKQEVKRYLSIGVDRSDVALLLASWGLSSQDLEQANEYLHEVEVDRANRDELGERIKRDKF